MTQGRWLRFSIANALTDSEAWEKKALLETKKKIAQESSFKALVFDDREEWEKVRDTSSVIAPPPPPQRSVKVSALEAAISEARTNKIMTRTTLKLALNKANFGPSLERTTTAGKVLASPLGVAAKTRGTSLGRLSNALREGEREEKRPAHRPSPTSIIHDHEASEALERLQQRQPKQPGLDPFKLPFDALKQLLVAEDVVPRGSSTEDLSAYMASNIKDLSVRTEPLLYQVIAARPL